MREIQWQLEVARLRCNRHLNGFLARCSMTLHVFQSSVEEVFLDMYSRSWHLQHVQGFRSFPNLQASPFGCDLELRGTP